MGAIHGREGRCALVLSSAGHRLPRAWAKRADRGVGSSRDRDGAAGALADVGELQFVNSSTDFTDFHRKIRRCVRRNLFSPLKKYGPLQRSPGGPRCLHWLRAVLRKSRLSSPSRARSCQLSKISGQFLIFRIFFLQLRAERHIREVFWGEQPPFISFGCGGRYFF